MWTNDETKNAIKLIQDGLSFKEIGEGIGKTTTSVKIKLNRLGYYASDYKIVKEVKLCENPSCNKEFEDYIINDRRYCSSSCAAKVNNISLTRHSDIFSKKEIRICKNIKCNLNFECNVGSIKIYCSNKCAVSDLNTLKLLKYISCLNCDNSLNYKKGGKFCSFKCHTEHRRKILEANIEAGLIRERKTLKKYLLEKNGHKCDLCKNTEWMGNKMPLVLDHIDGNPYNDFPNNLRLICCNCDAQTDTYMGKNKGNGRVERTQKYYEKKKPII